MPKQKTNMRTKWTDAMKKFLKDRYKKGDIVFDIAAKMQKKFKRRFTKYSVASQLQNLGLNPVYVKPSVVTKDTNLPQNTVRSPDKKLLKELEKERKRSEKLASRLQSMIDNEKHSIRECTGKSWKFACVSDTHIGSTFERPKLLEHAYKVIANEGVDTVFHCGDVLEGSGMRKGHEHEARLVGMDKQVKACVETYPEIKGITTYFILGSHDLSFFKDSGSNPGFRISSERKDMVQLGEGTSYVYPVKIDGTMVRIKLEHPAGGSSYALSYKPQKIIDSISGGKKPNILLIGHFHKAEFMPNYRNMFVAQAGCFQSQTDFMQGKGLAAHMGFWMFEIWTDKIGVSRMKAEFIPYYEKR